MGGVRLFQGADEGDSGVTEFDEMLRCKEHAEVEIRGDAWYSATLDVSANNANGNSGRFCRVDDVVTDHAASKNEAGQALQKRPIRSVEQQTWIA